MPTPKDKLAKLVNSFRIADYRLMSEATVRLSYIDSFWEALGWNIRDFNQVMVEQVDDFNKKPDYRFIVNGKTQFFVEAKKPSEKLINPRHIYQTKLYCWNGNVPLAILTDFEEFRPFHSIGQPSIEEAKKGLLTQFDMTFEQYPDRADELLNAFGREAVLAGSLQELLKTPPKMIRDSVDKAFLRSLSDWRKLIADNIAKNNQFKSEYDLSEAVQRILDRIVFLRVLNDRDIEDKDQLQLILSKGNDFYSHFVDVCRSFAPKYNGLIFNPHQVSEELEIDDYVFQPILKDFSYDNSPYRFDEIPVEMLGTIYEQFLGDEVTLDNGRAVIEQKPEVRKAGGVYYTPQYIVEYIVDNTVGKLLENCKTPADAAKLKICDPACGSGSFLLGAFDKLIKWHENYFAEHPEKAYDTIGKSKYLLAYQDGKDNNSPVRLTARMKGQILKNNLFGVDLDRQATEVAQMSLYIKCLEGLAKEPTFTLGFMEAILPKLEGNIKCGNSLIGSDFISEDFFGLSDKERRKINPFDWEEQFPFLKESGGYDAVIGNPPYLRVQGMQEHHTDVVPYLKSHYKSVESGSFDIYLVFIEKGLKLLNKSGLYGMILPHKFFQGDLGKNIRKYIADKQAIQIIVSFGANQIFQDASTYTCLLFLAGSNQSCFSYYKFELGDSIESDLRELPFQEIDIKETQKEKWNFNLGTKGQLLEKLENMPLKLGDIIRKIFQGLATSSDKIYVLKDIKKFNSNNNLLALYSQSLEKEILIEKGLVKPFLMGKDLKRYEPPNNKSYVVFPYLIDSDKPTLMTQEYIKNNFPFGWEYLETNRIDLENRERGRMKGEQFYAYIYPKNLNEFEVKKIMTPDISGQCQLTIDLNNLYHTTTIYSFVFKENIDFNINYLLGLLNSKIMWFFLTNTGNVLRGGYFRFKTEYLKPFPIPQSPKPEIHDKLVELVERMLKLNKDKQTADEFTRKQIEQYIARTDKEIDALVYELYGLTEEEIKIVENK